MSKFTTTLKGLMALALGSFALGAAADGDYIKLDGATAISSVPTEADNNAVYVIQSQQRGGLYSDTEYMQITHCGTENPSWWHGDIAVNADDEHQRFAIITKNGKKYLYSIAGKGFVTFEATPDRNPDGRAVISATDITNAELSMEKVENNGESFFTFKVKGYPMTNVSGYHHEDFKEVLFYSVVGVDAGSRYSVQKLDGVTLPADELAAALSNLDGPLATAKAAAVDRLNDIKEFYHDPSLITNDILLVNQATTETQINAIVNGVYDALDGKLVHLTYVPRENESTAKYLGVIGVGDNRIATLLDELGARTKWRLSRVAGTYKFRLYNIASDTYITASNMNGIMASVDGNLSFFEVDFKNNSSTKNAISLKFATNFICLTIGERTHSGTVYPHVLVWTGNTQAAMNNSAAVNDVNNAWRITPAGVNDTYLRSMEVGKGEYFVIRSNRALTGSPDATFAPKYPGSLLGCYTPDREKARKNATDNDNGVTFSNGVHVRQFMTGMQTIWKIVRQADGGYKIYSIMGEGENDAPLMGLTFSGDNNSEITITDNPTTVYFLDPTTYDSYTEAKRSPLPYGIAISTTSRATENKCFYLYDTLLGSDNGLTSTADFFVKANAGNPGSEDGTDNQGAVFYIERVSSTDVSAAKAAFIDYAKNHRMFELLKNVLNEDEIDYALAEKASMNPQNINSVAAAREYLNLGEQAASTRAFEQLDGKVIRMRNRADGGTFYLGSNNSSQLFNQNTNTDTDLGKLWRVEVVNPELRQFKLVNYKANQYVAPLPTGSVGSAVTLGESSAAGTYTMARYYSLDGKSFYANLLCMANVYTNNALLRVSQNNLVTRGPLSHLGSHWTLENAVANDVKNMQLDLTINAKGDLISIKHAEGGSLTKTANFPAAYTVKLTPKAAATPADAEATTPTEVVVPEANINPDGSGFVVNLDGLNVPEGEYTLNFPMGYFTANGKLAPALSKEVKVEDTTGIREVNAAEKGAAEVIYDLQGRRVSKAGKGVYIINGVKTLVK